MDPNSERDVQHLLQILVEQQQQQAQAQPSNSSLGVALSHRLSQGQSSTPLELLWRQQQALMGRGGLVNLPLALNQSPAGSAGLGLGGSSADAPTHEGLRRLSTSSVTQGSPSRRSSTPESQQDMIQQVLCQMDQQQQASRAALLQAAAASGELSLVSGSLIASSHPQLSGSVRSVLLNRLLQQRAAGPGLPSFPRTSVPTAPTSQDLAGLLSSQPSSSLLQPQAQQVEISPTILARLVQKRQQQAAEVSSVGPHVAPARKSDGTLDHKAANPKTSGKASASGGNSKSAGGGHHFPAKLYNVVQQAATRKQDHIVDFGPDSFGLVIKDMEVFQAQVLPEHFPRAKFPTFQRQLYLYGFRKKKSGSLNHYHHDYFQKDHPELLSQVQRKERFSLAALAPADAALAALSGYRENHSPKFPQKLYRMVLEAEAKGLQNAVIRFVQPHGFEVVHAERLAMELLPQYFHHQQFSSLRRQLNMYGFERTGRNSWIFRHPLFVRGQPQLLRDIRRVNALPSSDRDESEDDAE